jgi:acyl carrier protein
MLGSLLATGRTRAAIKHDPKPILLMQINAPEDSAAAGSSIGRGSCSRSVMIMSKEDIANLVRSALISVAPEVENQPLDPDADFRDQMDLDSMDFLNFIIALHEASGVDLPEKDYPQLASLNGCIEYLAARLNRS